MLFRSNGQHDLNTNRYPANTVARKYSACCSSEESPYTVSVGIATTPPFFNIFPAFAMFSSVALYINLVRLRYSENILVIKDAVILPTFSKSIFLINILSSASWCTFAFFNLSVACSNKIPHAPSAAPSVMSVSVEPRNGDRKSTRLNSSHRT